MNYQRNGTVPGNNPKAQNPQSKTEEGGVRVNGLQQILEMLAVADAPFRDSLLKRIAAENPKLAATLRSRLMV